MGSNLYKSSTESTPVKTMISIAHLADIHIRGLSRHDEYRNVFKKFTQSCLDRHVDHIFIAGDLFHTKTSGISPEYIDLLNELIRKMCYHCKVHITLGNHDGNLTNLQRQDAVSPIVDALQYELGRDLNLYKKSGVYMLEPGYNLCVFSCFDEEGWKNVHPVPGEVNIATYHGSVTGAVTETGWGLEGHVGLDFFDGYDFVMLGDIHKRQDLATRADAGGVQKPWISYPGSMIQQNYGEDLLHGYLHWQIGDRDHWEVQFVELPSTQPWVTLQWGGSAIGVLDEARRYLPGARTRVSSISRLSAAESDEVVTLLKREGASEVVIHSTESSSEDGLLILGESSVMKQDLRDPGTLFELVFNTYSGRYDLSDNEWQEIATKIEFYLKDISKGEEIQRGTRWTLESLHWDNTFAYGEGNFLTTSDFKGAVGIFGANRSGKSSIVGTLLYSLYSATDRGNLKNLHTINLGADRCETTAELHVAGRRYTVQRETVKHENKKGIVSSNSSLQFYETLESGDILNFRGEQRSDTEKPLRSLIGTADDFLLTAVATQGDVDGIIRFGGTQRKRIISRFIDIDIFDKLYERCNDDVKGLKATLKTFSDLDLEEQVKISERCIEEHKEKIAAAEALKDSLGHILEDLQTELRGLDVGVVRDLPALQRRWNIAAATVVTARETRDTKRSELRKLQSSISTLRDKLATFDPEALQSKINALESAEELRDSLQSTLKQKKARADVLKKNLQLLQSVPCGDSFPDCRFISTAMNDIGDAGTIAEEIRGITEQLRSATALVDTLMSENAGAKLLAYQSAVATLEASVERGTLLEQVVASLEEKVERLFSEEKALQEEYERYADISGASQQVSDLRSKIADITSQISAANGTVITSTSSIGRLEGRIEAATAEIAKKAGVLSALKELEVIAAAFSKKGLPSLIVAQQLPRINAEIATILGTVFDFSCELQIIDDDLEIYINDRRGRRIIELCSGMEKVICSLAIRIALVNISTLPKPDFFIIDEGFGALDDEGIVACGKFLSVLKHYFKWIGVITHVEGIKDTVDTIVHISQNSSGKSTVNHEKSRNS